MKPLPVTVKVKAAPPAIAEFGLMLLMEGTGFGCITVKVAPFEVPPPGAGLNTVTVACPGAGDIAGRDRGCKTRCAPERGRAVCTIASGLLNPRQSRCR